MICEEQVLQMIAESTRKMSIVEQEIDEALSEGLLQLENLVKQDEANRKVITTIGKELAQMETHLKSVHDDNRKLEMEEETVRQMVYELSQELKLIRESVGFATVEQLERDITQLESAKKTCILSVRRMHEDNKKKIAALEKATGMKITIVDDYHIQIAKGTTSVTLRTDDFELYEYESARNLDNMELEKIWGEHVDVQTKMTKTLKLLR